MQNETLTFERGEYSYQSEVDGQKKTYAPVYIESNHPLFALYTSGSTGKPKGIIHSTGGYGVFAWFTMHYSFDIKKRDIFWCTADAGWITGHSYLTYGALLHGITSLIVAGAPDYPAEDRWWEILEKNKVSVLYTSPTAIRLLRKYGTKSLSKRAFLNLRIIGSVGEPLNPDVAKWFAKYVGKNKATLIDTWWQTETGGHMIVTPLGLKTKLGKAGLPIPGVAIALHTADGSRAKIGQSGVMVITSRWPGALINCLHDSKRYAAYWNIEKEFFITGDIARQDKDGYFQILGRYDDVMNVSGHRIASAEVENAALTHPSVAEAAAIGIPHKIKGEAIKLFCTLKAGIYESESFASEIKNCVVRDIGSYAKPEVIEVRAKLPKTRSGKIMRRLLRAEVLGKDIGDLSTLED